MANIGIMGGSFDPVHTGHLIVASYIRQWKELDSIWLMVSPCNPLKAGTHLTPEETRLEMTRRAVEGCDHIEACGLELDMPRPSYTIDTLRTITARFPQHRFTLIIGSDNWCNFSRWRAAEEIVANYDIIVYPRRGYDVDPSTLPPRVSLVNAPLIEISSTFIRRALTDGRDMQWFVPAPVLDYITQHRLYTHN